MSVICVARTTGMDIADAAMDDANRARPQGRDDDTGNTPVNGLLGHRVLVTQMAESDTCDVRRTFNRPSACPSCGKA